MNLQAQVLALYLFENIQRNLSFPCDFAQIILSHHKLRIVQQGADQPCIFPHPAAMGLCSALLYISVYVRCSYL